MKLFNTENSRGITTALLELGVCSVYLAIASRIVFGKHPLKKASVSSGYYDAVTAIMNSKMFDSSKRRAVEAIKSDGTDEYYKSVICIVNSNMFETDKLNMIRELN